MMRFVLIFFFALEIHARAATHNWTNTPNATGYDPGDTVNLWGTFSTEWSVTNSGSVGNPITFYFEPGAKFSAATLTDGHAWITINGRSCLVFDGGQNGLIELTDNGTTVADGGAHTYHNSVYGIYGRDGSALDHITVQNLTISNLYHRDAITDGVNGGIGFSFIGSDVTVSNCVFDMMQDCIGNIYTTTPYSNCVITACLLTNFNHGITLGSGGVPTPIYLNFIVTNNTIQLGDAFESPNGVELGLHRNPIFIFNNAPYTDGYVSNLVIACNRIGSGGANPQSVTAGTGAIYFGVANNRNCFHARVFNNISTLKAPLSWSGGDGAIGAWGTDVLVANNTVYAWATNGVWGGSEAHIRGTNASFYNNIIVAAGAVNLSTTTDTTGLTADNPTVASLLVGVWSDYNVLNHTANNGWTFLVQDTNNATWTQGQLNNLAQWQTYLSAPTHFDPHSTESAITLDANYYPSSGDTVAVGKGTNLSAFFTTDFYGNPRSAVGNWTIGAVEGSAQAQPPASGGTATATTMSAKNVHVGTP